MTWSLKDVESNFNTIMHNCVSKHVKFKCLYPGFITANYQGRFAKTFRIDQRTILEQCNDINHIMVMSWQQVRMARETAVISKLPNHLYLPD